ncbi:MAG: hypothetical protein ACP5MZ_04495 [Candidatus Micrarchaeia archaeon]
MAAFGVLVAVSAVMAITAVLALGRQVGYSTEAQQIYMNYSYMQEVSALGLSAASCTSMNESSLASFYEEIAASAMLDGINASLKGGIITIYKDSYPNIYKIVDCG